LSELGLEDQARFEQLVLPHVDAAFLAEEADAARRF
jgi:hypothetical protein